MAACGIEQLCRWDGGVASKGKTRVTKAKSPWALRWPRSFPGPGAGSSGGQDVEVWDRQWEEEGLRKGGTVLAMGQGLPSRSRRAS